MSKLASFFDYVKEAFNGREFKINISMLKSILIVVLAALTIYQTGVLWLVNITNRTFLFNYFPFLHQEAIPEGADRLVTPWRIIMADYDGSFKVKYNDLAEARRYGDKVISHLFQGGAFVSSRPLDHELDVFLSFYHYQTNPIYIYEYAFPMDAEWFTQGFGQRGNILTARGMGRFRQVVIVPPSYGKADARVFFLCEDAYVHEFTVTPQTSDGFYTQVPEDFAGFNYIWDNGQFIRHGDFFFYGVRVTNPYADAHGSFLMDFIENQVASFFNNPAAIETFEDGNVWIFRGVTTVVRYYATHVLEYISYRAIDRNVPSSFINDFAAAVRFLDRDHLVINDTYLAGFREDRGRNIFYFNYVINNTPLIMPQNWPLGSYLEHPIVITVDHGTVVNYRKLAFNFETNEELWGIASANFNNAADFDDVRLGFRIGGRDIELLHWFANSRSFPVPHNINIMRE